jgi:hypothetical protein
MQIKELDKYISKSYNDDVVDMIDDWAKSHGLSVNVIPTAVGNIDIDDARLNVWVDFNSGNITKFTIG